jgi:hypothetical protein
VFDVVTSPSETIRNFVLLELSIGKHLLVTRKENIILTMPTIPGALHEGKFVHRSVCQNKVVGARVTTIVAVVLNIDTCSNVSQDVIRRPSWKLHQTQT